MKTGGEQNLGSGTGTLYKIAFWFVAVVAYGTIAFQETGFHMPNLIGYTLGGLLTNLGFGGFPYVLSVERKKRSFPKFAKYMFFTFLILNGFRYFEILHSA